MEYTPFNVILGPQAEESRSFAQLRMTIEAL
jgi:hypothetical protein